MLELMLAATSEAGEAHADPTALGLDPTQWVALSMIAILALFIWKKVPAAVGKALDKKIDGIRAQLAEAESLRKDAESLKAEYEAKSRAAEGEAAAMVERAQAEAKAIVAKAKTDAKSLVERRQRMAEDKIAAEERAAIAEIRATTAKAATAAAARLVASKHDAGSDKKLIDQAIAVL
ncbi:F0F1 ATP synthase subunit B [Sphingomonas mesophila]|uniref:F0F1 ATP synthase subunit B family protein n=1 Tax=Sphingomonas mesophila TaxID=2303576 RepID=UPI000E5789E1|nr:F0F1 ATP synthase subunit B [Sphingomonas mesophila]